MDSYDTNKRATFYITDRNGRKLEVIKIDEEGPVKALIKQGELTRAANARYGQPNIYTFTHWEGSAPSQHIPGSNADKNKDKHRPFPEERGEPLPRNPINARLTYPE